MAIRNNKVQFTDPQQRKDKITRIVALAVVFVGTFYFFIKLLFL